MPHVFFFGEDSFVHTSTIHFAYGCASHTMLNQAAMLLPTTPFVLISYLFTNDLGMLAGH